MISVILLLLILLWLLGYLQVPLFASTLFNSVGRVVTLNDLLVFLIIIWLIGILPYPFREIAGVLFLLWILGALGIIAIPGFSTIVLIAIIFGVIAFIARMTGID